MSIIVSVVSFVVVFSVVTLAHEFGHYIFSRRAGIRVLEMGLGFGPRIVAAIKGKTMYTLNLLPLGGFIRIAGLDEEAGEEAVGPEESYMNKKPAQKFLSIFGGPLFNLILAFLIFFIMFTFTGAPSGISNEIATVSPGSVSARLGIKSGDKVLSISGIKIVNMADAVSTIHQSAGKRLKLTINRGGKTFNLTAVPELNKKLKIGLIGITLKPIYVRTSILSAIAQSFMQVAATSAVIIYTLALLIIGKLSIFDLAGPVGIAQFTGQVAGEGIIPLLSFTAFLSINLGVFNLLPIPALDGGRLVFIIIEGVRKKAIDIKIENRIHQVGLTILLGLMAIISVNDLFRILRR